MAIGSALLVIVCGVLFASLYASASGKVAVLEASRTVAPGTAITVKDLKSVNISVSAPGSAIPVSRAASVVGKSAAVTIPAGGILAPGDVTVSWQPPAGESLVGVALRQSQEPASGVQPGEYVDVIFTGAPGAAFQMAGTSQEQMQTGIGATAAAGSASPAGIGSNITQAGGAASLQHKGQAINPSLQTSAASQVGSPTGIQPSSGMVGSILASRVRVTDVTAGSQSSQSNKVLVSLLVPSVLAPVIAAASSAGQVAVAVTRMHS
ncbi:MAG: SAF domain-containing protein [Actinobacteria bacterium]|nr:SAF domain-containing protein [Actinomycetota bacterium]MCL5447239.1 SAF domain-containing protein [Actinomycetota bacterium]